MFDLPTFISEHITQRKESLFASDLAKQADVLKQRISNQRVLVIGGAGTIGSSYIRALLKYEPASLVVIDTNENGLTELTRDLRSRADLNIPKDYRTYPISFAGPVFRKILKAEKTFDIVANFAAHKHVRSEKDHFSIEAMIRNNVIDAKDLLDRLLLKKPKHFFCVSTDKAANPVNVMGASKKLMEEAILAYSKSMKITTARFANVAFSNGSLLFGFNERLARKQPLSSPNDVKRYFVSPDESGQLCLLSCICGESGDIFFPKLGEEQMMTFSSIADEYLASKGLKPFYCKSDEEARKLAEEWTPGKPYPVYYFATDTSGEKGFEEFYTDSELLDMDSFSQLGVIKNAPKKEISDIENTINLLEKTLNDPNTTKADVVAAMKGLIPDFAHIETGKNLDDKM